MIFFCFINLVARLLDTTFFLIFHFLKYLCNVNSRRLVWLQCTFSYSASLDSDFDCVHLTIQGIFSLVWSPGKTIFN